jgi:16S rRNA (cytosine967-C5)-methyltransferase
LPDPARQPVDHLALSTSHPVWLVSRWVSSFGREQTLDICHAGMCRPPMILRPNRLRTDLDKLVDALRTDGVEALQDSDSGVLIVPEAAHVTRSAAFVGGLFQMQDRTAMGVVQAMHLSPGATIIDLCSGPGTKTTQMAEIINNDGVILASDKDDDRLALVRENCGRLGATCVRTIPPWEREAAFREPARIDWILIDAPCSNTGVLARRPEARYRVDTRSLDSLVTLQKQLLSEAVRFASPRTRLAYSTCSLEPEENEDLVAWFAQEHPDWQIMATRRTFPTSGQSPSDWHDGGFWALWGRI